jgi:DNA-binding PadR family transcriptional regulator
MSAAKAKVLEFFLRDPDEPRYGYEVMRETGVKSGSMYPIFEQLERLGWLTSSWEPIDEQQEGRPPRRWYRLTADGKTAAPVALEEFGHRKAGDARVAWKPGMAT